MKRILFIIGLLTFVSFAIYSQSIPKQISYQGVLKNAAGVNVTDGSYSLLFKVYNEPTGGTPLWTETQSVTVKNGFFSAQLGSVTPIASVPFDRLHFLGITVGTGTELTPRTMLTPSPYSFMAMNVMDSAVVKSFNGLKGNINLVAGTNITLIPSGNNITINASTGGGGTIGGSGTTNYLPVFTNTATLGNSNLSQDASGNIQTGLDGTGKWLILSANDNVHEGGQIKWNGAAAYDDWLQDSYINNMRFFTNSANTNTFEIFNSGTGTSGLNVEGKVGIGTQTPLYALHVRDSVIHVIHGEYSGTTNTDASGVHGISIPADNFGIGGYFTGGYMGVRGVISSGNLNASYYGVYGLVSGTAGTKYGIRGSVSGTGTTNYAIYGTVTGATTNWAGYFSGNVSVTGTLSKGGGSFKIDHPLDPANKYLYHSFVESPDMMNIYNGNVVTDASGYTTVTLPDWFEPLNKDFRYQLTVIGDFAQAIIAQEVQNNQFSIRTDKPNIKVSWQITGIRKDAFAEKNRIPVEELKQGNEVGKYLYPDAYDMPENLGIDYENNKEALERK